MQATRLKQIITQHHFKAYRAYGPSSTAAVTLGLGLSFVWGHAELLVAARLPMLGLALGSAVAHELAAGAGEEGDAGLLGEAAVGTLPAARQGLLRGHGRYEKSCIIRTSFGSRWRISGGWRMVE